MKLDEVDEYLLSLDSRKIQVFNRIHIYANMLIISISLQLVAKLKANFDKYDNGSTGFLYPEQIRPLLSDLNRSTSDEKVTQWLKSLELKDERIDFAKFVNYYSVRYNSEQVFLFYSYESLVVNRNYFQMMIQVKYFIFFPPQVFTFIIASFCIDLIEKTEDNDGKTHKRKDKSNDFDWRNDFSDDDQEANYRTIDRSNLPKMADGNILDLRVVSFYFSFDQT
jgi:hypothetical protein